MNPTKFQELLTRPESSILDFKREMYDFSDDRDGSKVAKFLKDAISFSNTIRNESAFIVIGVEENEDGSKNPIGISNFIDDAILQDKIKDKAYPRIIFHSFLYHHRGKNFGVIEFPITRYEFPITSCFKLKGLDIGKVYYRQGSMNCEGLSLDVIRINEWQKSIQASKILDNNASALGNFLKRVVSAKESLSIIFIELLQFSRSNKLDDLFLFCSNELSGVDTSQQSSKNSIRIDSEIYKFRVLTLKFSLLDIAPNPYGSINAEQFKFELEKSEDFFSFQFFFHYPIAQIESFIKKQDGFAKIRMPVKDLLPNYKKDVHAHIYMFNSDAKTLYQNIRQRAIDLIMKASSG